MYGVLGNNLGKLIHDNPVLGLIMLIVILILMFIKNKS